MGRLARARVDRGVRRGREPRVEVREASLQAPPAGHGAAREALDVVRRSVQLEDVRGARDLMQPVHVLRDESPHVALALKLGNGAVRVVRGGLLGEPAPADERPGPVSSLVRLGLEEVLVRHRLEAARVSSVGLR